MKKVLSLMIGIFLLVSLAPNIMAQDIEEEAGTTPDNLLWGLDRAAEQIRYALTFGNENKVNYGLKVAEERLAEIKEMSKKEDINPEDIAKAEVARQRINNRTRERAMNNESLQNRARERTRNQERRLTQLRQELPSEAQKGLDTAIENRKRRVIEP